MRALIVGPDEKAAITKLVAFAEQPEHWYFPGSDFIPGNNPDYVVSVPQGFRCVFTFTKKGGTVFRHLTISVPGARYPTPEASIMLALEFGFTSRFKVSSNAMTYDLMAKMEHDGWLFSADPDEHCVVLLQPVEERSYA